MNRNKADQVLSDMDQKGRYVFNLYDLTKMFPEDDSKTLHEGLRRLVKSGFDTFTKWENQSKSNELIFPGKNGVRLDRIDTSWRSLMRLAHISNFRFHDLRHHFASKLVMSGVDLNTVRELLGHGDIEMTLRYAHLAPQHKAAAVEKLVDFTIESNQGVNYVKEQ